MERGASHPNKGGASQRAAPTYYNSETLEADSSSPRGHQIDLSPMAPRSILDTQRSSEAHTAPHKDRRAPRQRESHSWISEKEHVWIRA